MKRVLLALAVLMAFYAAQGCGGGGGGAPQAPQAPQQVTTTIASNQNVDGYLTKDTASQTIVATQVTQKPFRSIFAGVDPSNSQESRAFLDFPLASIPPKASVQFASLKIFLHSTNFNSASDTLTLRIELVQFNPQFTPPLLASYFDSSGLPLQTDPLIPVSPSILPPITANVVGPNNPIAIDVSQLVKTAHDVGFSDFQIRILENRPSGAPSDLIEIDESSATVSPSLTVQYQQ